MAALLSSGRLQECNDLQTGYFVADRQSALDAARLLEDHGAAAPVAAAANAALSRDRGNVAHFCRWRQIGRLIAAMADADGEQTRH